MWYVGTCMGLWCHTSFRLGLGKVVSGEIPSCLSNSTSQAIINRYPLIWALSALLPHPFAAGGALSSLEWAWPLENLIPKRSVFEYCWNRTLPLHTSHHPVWGRSPNLVGPLQKG